MIPNRVVIAAIDHALNRVQNDAANKKCSPELVQECRDDYAALLEARKCVIDNRRDTGGAN